MYLTAIPLKRVASVNSFETSTQWLVRQGNPATIYFQLADGEQLQTDGKPLRYMPDAGATVSVTFSSIVSSYSITKTATQPFSQDTSIWSISINATDNLASGNFVFTLTEGSTVRTGMVDGGISVQSLNPSFC